jgi:hypothetical protein
MLDFIIKYSSGVIVLKWTRIIFLHMISSSQSTISLKEKKAHRLVMMTEYLEFRTV